MAETTVNLQGLVDYEGKYYSVPIRFKGQNVKIKETLDHHIEIYSELECIASHPLITGKARLLTRMDHYREKEKKEKNVTTNGLATSHNPLQAPKVEHRSLQVYEEQLKAGENN